MPRGQPVSTREQKINWLLLNRPLWDGPLTVLRDRMIAAGLYSKLSFTYDVDASIRTHVALAKAQKAKRDSS